MVTHDSASQPPVNAGSSVGSGDDSSAVAKSGAVGRTFAARRRSEQGGGSEVVKKRSDPAGVRGSSLALRLFMSATAWTVVILVVTGIILSSLYREAVERAFDRRLGVYLRTLVAEVAAPEDATDRQPLGEPLFELPLSGWYWQITRLNVPNVDVRSSRSLWDGGLPQLAEQGLALATDGTRRSYVQGPEDQRLRLIERTVDLGEDGRFLIAVAGDSQEIDDETRSFDRALAVTFVMLAVVLLLITMFQVRFGLAPLKRISESLAAIRAGRAERLEGRFPVEIAPLARETNALIEANREIVERARTHVGNLAHALKTPLSVMVNEATARPDDPFAAKVREQADIMRDQVARHLERARLAARLTVVGTVTDVAPALGALTRTMDKLYRDRGIVIDADVPADLKFRGERQDLDEMLGNLVDNACKWAQSRVGIEVTSEGAGADKRLHIVVDDDGPGLTASEREQVVAHRGRRLDETKPGSGLGLSIVIELAALYRGSLTLDAAPIGGLRTELVLPAA
jgi:signal transduction histidine kinase